MKNLRHKKALTVQRTLAKAQQTIQITVDIMAQNQQDNQSQHDISATPAITQAALRIFSGEQDRMAFDAEVARINLAMPVNPPRANPERNNRVMAFSELAVDFSRDTGKQETMTCETHGDYVATVLVSLPSKNVFSSCPDCVALKKQRDSEALAAKKLADQNAKLQKLIGSAGIPKFFAKKTFDAFVPTSEEQSYTRLKFEHFAAKISNEDFGGFLIAFGATGAGKTHLSVATAINAVSKNNTALYMLASDVIRSLRNTWAQGSDKTETEVLQQLATVDLLVIDEIGVQFGTESEQNHLFEVINSRILEVKPTILVTNLLLNSPDDNVKTLRKYLGERTYDRLREVGESVCFDWQSHRGMK